MQGNRLPSKAMRKNAWYHADPVYGNPLYTSPAGRVPEIVTPEPDKHVQQICDLMVKHFSGRVEYYETWNEPNIDSWNPAPNPEDFWKAVQGFFRSEVRGMGSVDESD